jgi:hypothetical protein
MPLLFFARRFCNVDKHLTLAFAALTALSTVAYGQQLGAAQNGSDVYQVGYAANLNIGDSVVNLSNAGAQSGFFVTGQPGGGGALGNICVNVYTFDPQEEEINCCSCLVTPNALNSLSAKADLISNTLTPAIPTSIVIKLIASVPALVTGSTTAFNVCNPAKVAPTGTFQTLGVANTAGAAGNLTNGMIAWGATLEPSSSAGTFGPVNVPFLKEPLTTSELTALTTVCNFIQSNGTGYGVCKTCGLGALSGTKQ